MDLIINLVNIVKGVVDFEWEIFEVVINVCVNVMSVKIDFSNFDV